MGEKTPAWEAELWAYLSRGAGVQCPIYQSCELRLEGMWCLSDHEDFFETLNEFVDDDDPNPAAAASSNFESLPCPTSGKIFKLVTRLATKYHLKAGIERLPVTADLITRAYDNLPIEVRQVPLKAYHGSIWRLRDCWLIQLNSNDTPARQRFTLYHEIFHVLAHCKATPVFKKTSCSREGSFNELLADHFSTAVLAPRECVAKMWLEVKDISQMAAIFDMPKSVMLLALKAMRLI